VLPEQRTPTREDWAELSQRWQARLDERIRHLQQLRDDFSGCIGCGCLSIDRCLLVNPYDRLGEHGPGPRRLLEPASTQPPAAHEDGRGLEQSLGLNPI
jgi:MerR family redox-sensitive transcriptional activator SoxR